MVSCGVASTGSCGSLPLPLARRYAGEVTTGGRDVVSGTPPKDLARDQACPSEDALVEFVGGTGSEDARAAIESHIDQCERCAETLALFGGAYATAGEIAEPPPEPDAAADARPGDASAPHAPPLFAGRYQIRECVGAGAGGTVYAAWDPELDRVVALKVLRGQATGGSRGAHRIAREARVMAKVVHPNVVTVHDVGSTGDHVFIAAEFIEGGTLDSWRQSQSRSWAQVVEVFVAAGRGLAAIHDCGLVHRDFKPQNVMVGNDGRVRVTDFGLARLQPELEREHLNASLDTSEDPTMSPGMLAETLATRTRTGALVGTPAYMSPEQWRGDIADARSDQFSYCVALYEALFAGRPFGGRTATELSAAVCGDPLPQPPAARVPRWVTRVVMRGLTRDPSGRFPDMNALLAALVDTPRRRRRRRISALVAAGFVGVGVSTYVVARMPATAGCSEPEALAELWDATAREEVREILGIEFDVTSAGVERWIEDWRSTQVQVCETSTDAAHTVAAQVSLECLDRRLSSMRAAISVMRESGSSGAALVAMIDTMPSPTECADATLLLSIQPDHNTPMGRVLSAILADDIDRIEALRYAGRHDEAMAITIAVVAQAEIDGDHATRALALLTLGQLYSAHKDPQLAINALRAATWAAEASGHVEVAVDAWVELAAVMGGQLERYEDGLAATERAQAALFRLRDPSRSFGLASNEAMLHSVAGKYDLALAGQLEALERGTVLLGPRHRQIARVHLNLAAVLSHLGRIDEAAAHAAQGIEIQRELYPGPNPVTADMLNTLGALEIQRKRFDQGRAALDEALTLLGDGSESVRATRASVLSNRAALDLNTGDAHAAVGRYEEVLALYREIHGAAHPEIALALHNLAGALDSDGVTDRAIAMYREALAMRLGTSGPEHPSTANTMHNLGNILARHGDLAEGIAMLERALQIRETSNVDPWRRASTRFMLARALERRGDRAAALHHASQSRALLLGIAPSHADTLVQLDTWLAGLAPKTP